MQELNLLHPLTNIHRNVTGKCLPQFFDLQLSSPSAISSNFIEDL